ncbi:hypothetical protein RRF57_001186 [Xylaria bambusicola]|uniref:Uncharacterized protein n=1 Tax=Xylaria bambusicola TaxID=326684 RepID=A0AAN7U4K6_9PEZI
MSLPPVEKLPLALRKSVRDGWEAKKGDLEAKVTKILGTEWTIDVNPNQVFAYAGEERSYARESLGACIHEYFDSATRRLQEFSDHFKEDGVKELNTIAYAHVLNLDLDEQKRFSYCGCDVFEGRLRLLFSPGNLGCNIGSCLDREVLAKALNDAPAPEDTTASMSFHARTGIRQDYDPKIEEIRARIGEILSKPDIKLNPNFEENYAKLLEESKAKKTDLLKEWQQLLGGWTKNYFSGLLSQLQWQKFEDDELLQEGFNDVVDKGEVVLRLVDKLQKDSYCECVIEDGILYLQTTPKTWGSNIDNAASKLIDLL